MELGIIFLLGLIIGSFLNVCIFRVPKGKSIVYPPSSCMSCEARIPSYYLIPVLGYILTRGKCFNCRGKISIQYPIIEMISAIIAVILCSHTNTLMDFILYFNFFLVLLAITVVDLESMTIPDQFIIYLIICSLPYIFYNQLYYNFLAALSLGIVFYIIAVVSKGGMGGGDVKLSFVMGLYLGLSSGVLAVFAAFLTGGLVGVIILLLGGSKKKAIPFAPFLVLGTVIAYFFGEVIIAWYLKSIGF